MGVGLASDGAGPGCLLSAGAARSGLICGDFCARQVARAFRRRRK